MAVVTPTARRSAARRPPRRPGAKQRLDREAAPPLTDTVSQARELAWAGQHANAIDVCTRALAANGRGSRSNGAMQMPLLDVRAESRIALGQLDRAAQDAAAMFALAN